MSRLTLFVLLLQLPFCSYSMLEEFDQTATETPVYAESHTSTPLASSHVSNGSSQSSHDDFDALFNMPLGTSANASSASTADQSHVDISYIGGLTDLLGISESANDRTIVGGFLRWGAKRTGYLQSDLAGIGNYKERIRTEKILRRYSDMLLADEEFNQDLQRQFLERQAATTPIVVALLKELQSLNRKNPIADPLLKIQAAQQLLEIHEEITLAPQITQSLKVALKLARITTRQQLESRTETDS